MNWPKTTVIGRVLSKEKIYAQGNLTGALRRALVDDVEKITIAHRLARETLNVDIGTEFPEILVLNIKLKQKNINENLLNALDKSIRAGYVLFILEYSGQQCASISHKTINAKGDSTIDRRWTCDWADDIELELRGTTVDALYRALIEQISDGRINAVGGALRDAVNRDVERLRLEKQIEKLEKKLYSENQLNKQIEIKRQISALKEKIDG